MSIRIDMTSNDIDRQIALLKFYPEVIKKHFRPALYRSVNKLKNEIAPNIPVDSGRALAAFRASVSGSGINMTGRVGWFNVSNPAPWYINVVEYGSKPHQINSYAPGAGVYIGKHPGMKGAGFMAAGYAAMQPIIDQTMGSASEAVVNELSLERK